MSHDSSGLSVSYAHISFHNAIKPIAKPQQTFCGFGAVLKIYEMSGTNLIALCVASYVIYGMADLASKNKRNDLFY